MPFELSVYKTAIPELWKELLNWRLANVYLNTITAKALARDVNPI